MSRTHKYNDKYARSNADKGRRQRRIAVRAIRRDEPDLRRLGRALIAFAVAEAEANAANRPPSNKRTGPRQAKGSSDGR